MNQSIGEYGFGSAVHLFIVNISRYKGRAIRHQNDWASLILIDQRYATTRIQSKLPQCVFYISFSRLMVFDRRWAIQLDPKHFIRFENLGRWLTEAGRFLRSSPIHQRTVRFVNKSRPHTSKCEVSCTPSPWREVDVRNVFEFVIE